MRNAATGVLAACVLFSTLAVSGDLQTLSEDLMLIMDTNPTELIREAVEAYREENYPAAAEFYIHALLSDLENNPVVLYNLACCYGLMGEEELSGNALVMAAEAGFDRIELINTDPDLDNVKEGLYFQECMGQVEEIIHADAHRNSESVLGDRLYLEFPSMQTIRVHLPEGYDQAEPCDLVLTLHGYSGDVTEFSGRWSAFEESDFIYASLQAPYAFEAEGHTVYSWTVYGSSPWDGQDMPDEQMDELFESSLDLSSDMVVATAEKLTEEYTVDRLFLLGFSQGGILTYWTAFRHPELLDGIAVFSGVLEEETASDEMLESASTIPVFLGRGAQEDDRALLARDRLTEAGFDVTFHEYQGGHYFPDSSLRAFQDWMQSDSI
ncbi:MAG: hypothetical protein GF388_05035 [Candidatus Aegiribacteria sp.]|nr:hypothetical protein [Candidatus Aegiribacteria sp.]MBD3294583.1 hypothetical protein [Candidatus Fermentibacteria bacterium]